MNDFTLPNAASVSVYPNPDTLALAVAKRIVSVVHQAIVARGVCRIALAGGETPSRSYQLLCNMPVDWAHVHIYFGDERCLPVGDTQRNDTMAQYTLLQHVAISATNIHSIPAELGAQAAASRYALKIEQALPFDLVLLGMGEDGHTASLFPGNPTLRTNESAAAVFNAPKSPPERVTLSMVTLNTARIKIILAAGSGKRIALQRIAQNEPLPAGQIIEAEWYVDQAALPSG